MTMLANAGPSTRTVQLYCLCGALIVGRDEPELVETLERTWQAAHLGEGHGETDQAVCARVRAAKELERFGKRKLGKPVDIEAAAAAFDAAALEGPGVVIVTAPLETKLPRKPDRREAALEEVYAAVGGLQVWDPDPDGD